MPRFPAEKIPFGAREYPQHPIVGVGGVVVSEGRALLARRGKPPLEGEWSIPGGAVEVGETLHEALRRELAEETGLQVRVLDLIEAFERISRDPSGRTQYHFVVLDYFCLNSGGEARAGSDASEIAWVAESDLSKYALASQALAVIRKGFQRARQSSERSGS